MRRHRAGMQHPPRPVDHHGAVLRYLALHAFMLAAIKAWRRRSRTRRELRALSACELKDIGLSNWDQQHESAKWFWQR
jgi:uncharacterized protein YjiS (DUF1127 family)